jgi:hypothetical protein
MVSTILFLGMADAAEFRVDSAQIDSDYRNGEFEKIESALKPILRPGASAIRRDSLLAWKYLAVVYAANPATREKGRYCMLRMLELDPASDLLDLFVGEQVDDVFGKARRENELTTRETPPPPEPAKAASPPPVLSRSDGEEAESDPTAFTSSRPRKFLVTTLAAAAVAGLTWYSWENAAAREKTYRVPPP